VIAQVSRDNADSQPLRPGVAQPVCISSFDGHADGLAVTARFFQGRGLRVTVTAEIENKQQCAVSRNEPRVDRQCLTEAGLGLTEVSLFSQRYAEIAMRLRIISPERQRLRKQATASSNRPLSCSMFPRLFCSAALDGCNETAFRIGGTASARRPVCARHTASTLQPNAWSANCSVMVRAISSHCMNCCFASSDTSARVDS